MLELAFSSKSSGMAPALGLLIAHHEQLSNHLRPVKAELCNRVDDFVINVVDWVKYQLVKGLARVVLGLDQERGRPCLLVSYFYFLTKRS